VLLIVVAFAVSDIGRDSWSARVLRRVLGGLSLGFVIVPLFLKRMTAGLLALRDRPVAVLALAVVGQVLGSILGRGCGAVVWQPVQLVDAVSGSIVSVIAVLQVRLFLGWRW